MRELLCLVLAVVSLIALQWFVHIAQKATFQGALRHARSTVVPAEEDSQAAQFERQTSREVLSLPVTYLDLRGAFLLGSERATGEVNEPLML